MIQNHALNAYQKTTVETADPVALVIMCYERTIRDLQAAMRFHGGRQMPQAYDKVRHAQDILTELLVGLDYERGGSIAGNLSRLYNFMLRELIAVNSQKNTRVYEDIVKMLTELKEAYTEVHQRHGREAISLKEQQPLGGAGYQVTG